MTTDEHRQAPPGRIQQATLALNELAAAAEAINAACDLLAWHRAQVSNGPTEAVNNLVKRVKRVAFGITNLRNYRIRALLYAGKPNWELLPTLTPR